MYSRADGQSAHEKNDARVADIGPSAVESSQSAKVADGRKARNGAGGPDDSGDNSSSDGDVKRHNWGTSFSPNRRPSRPSGSSRKVKDYERYDGDDGFARCNLIRALVRFPKFKGGFEEGIDAVFMKYELYATSVGLPFESSEMLLCLVHVLDEPAITHFGAHVLPPSDSYLTARAMLPDRYK